MPPYIGRPAVYGCPKAAFMRMRARYSHSFESTPTPNTQRSAPAYRPLSMQVMHLVRDPRDAMLSALALWRGQDGGLEFQSSEFCRRTMAKVTSTDSLPDGQHMAIKLEQVT
jgi:hypothetical protein